MGLTFLNKLLLLISEVTVYIDCSSIQKLQRRQATFYKTNALTKEQKDKWAPCVVMEMMSSEDSGEGSDEENTSKFMVRSLPWRSDKVNSLFDSIDAKVSKTQTKKSMMMTIQLEEGLVSDRIRPVSDKIPDWAMKPLI